ncbi:MAG: SDR family oxidoreductase [Sulfurospirillum sp.]|nr:SDR family oxidoreductase [Sulfurospirillum sp.]
MDLKIKNRVALVTGSTQGIGFATAKKLCEEGATVIINGRSTKSVQNAIDKIKNNQKEAKISGIVADLKDEKGCATLIEKLDDVDILINNLGIFEPKDFTQISNDDWMHTFNVNVMSGVRLSQHCLPKMLEKNWGRIVFISSESALQIPKEMIHYGVTKTAQVSLARGIAEITKGTGVTSNSIIVGPSSSEGVSRFMEELAKEQGKSFEEIEKFFFDEVRPTSLIQRFCKVEEIANMVAYVSSANSSATNGTLLRVDGGVVQSAF